MGPDESGDEEARAAPWYVRWVWERPFLIVASFFGLIAWDLAVYRWPPSAWGVVLYVALGAPVVVAVARRERVRRLWERISDQENEPRHPQRVEVATGIGDRLRNLAHGCSVALYELDDRAGLNGPDLRDAHWSVKAALLVVVLLLVTVTVLGY